MAEVDTDDRVSQMGRKDVGLVMYTYICTASYMQFSHCSSLFLMFSCICSTLNPVLSESLKREKTETRTACIGSKKDGTREGERRDC